MYMYNKEDKRLFTNVLSSMTEIPHCTTKTCPAASIATYRINFLYSMENFLKNVHNNFLKTHNKNFYRKLHFLNESLMVFEPNTLLHILHIY